MRLFVCLTFFVILFSSGAYADVLYLQDGSRVAGEISELNADAVRIDTSFAGVLTVERAVLSGIESNNMMVVDMNTGDRMIGTLIYSDTEGQRLNSSLLGTVALNVKDIKRLWDRSQPAPELKVLEEVRTETTATIQKLKEEHAQEVAVLKDKAENTSQEVWSGSVNFGYSGSDGNTDESNFHGKVTAKRETEFDRLTMSLQGKFENDEGVETKNEILAKGTLERDLNDRLFAFGALSMERDRFEEVDLRTNLTGGLGYFLVKRDNLELKPRLGIGYEVTAFKNDPNEEELIFSTGYDYLMRLWGKMELTHVFSYFPTVDDWGGDYRIDSDAALLYPINDEKTWNFELGLQHQYDSMPATDIMNLDTYYSFGVTRKFD